MDKYQQTLKNIDKFNRDRHWKNLSLEDLAKSICIESAELLEHFQWSSSRKKIRDTEKISLEVADIFWYLATFCHEAKIDLLIAMAKKIKILETKYPKEVFAEKAVSEEIYLKYKQEYRNKFGR